jgi:hypothetical protein
MSAGYSNTWLCDGIQANDTRIGTLSLLVHYLLEGLLEDLLLQISILCHEGRDWRSVGQLEGASGDSDWFLSPSLSASHVRGRTARGKKPTIEASQGCPEPKNVEATAARAGHFHLSQSEDLRDPSDMN